MTRSDTPLRFADAMEHPAPDEAKTELGLQ
jgi:hypothetical protein